MSLAQGKGGMIMVTKKHSFLIYFLALCVSFGIASCAGREKKPVAPRIKYNIAPEANVTNFRYFLDEKCKIAKKPCLTVKMTVKNCQKTLPHGENDRKERFR
jgi:hypothetical protein